MLATVETIFRINGFCFLSYLHMKKIGRVEILSSSINSQTLAYDLCVPCTNGVGLALDHDGRHMASGSGKSSVISSRALKF